MSFTCINPWQNHVIRFVNVVLVASPHATPHEAVSVKCWKLWVRHTSILFFSSSHAFFIRVSNYGTEVESVNIVCVFWLLQDPFYCVVVRTAIPFCKSASNLLIRVSFPCQCHRGSTKSLFLHPPAQWDQIQGSIDKEIIHTVWSHLNLSSLFL